MSNFNRPFRYPQFSMKFILIFPGLKLTNGSKKKDLFEVPCYLHFPQLMFDIIFYQMCRPRKKENDNN